MALHMRPVYTVLLGHGQRGLLGGRVPVPVAPVHAQKSDLWRPIRLNDTEDVQPAASSGQGNLERIWTVVVLREHCISTCNPGTRFPILKALAASKPLRLS